MRTKPLKRNGGTIIAKEVSEHPLTAFREGRTGEGSMVRYARKIREAEAAKAASGLPVAPVEEVPQHSSK